MEPPQCQGNGRHIAGCMDQATRHPLHPASAKVGQSIRLILIACMRLQGAAQTPLPEAVEVSDEET